MGIYSKLEEKYYSLMDWIEEKGLKVYEFFVNPIESRGIPSFPVFVLLIALICVGAFFLVSSLLGPQSVTMRVSVSSEGNPLADVRVRLTVDGVDQPFLSKTDENGLAELTGIPSGRKAVLRIEQTGYDVFLKQIDSTSAGTVSAEMQLAPEAKKLRVLVTNLEGDYIGDAMLSYLDPSSGAVQQLATNADGIAELSFASEEDIFRIKVTRDGFTTKTQTCFASQAQCSVELTPESELPVDEGGTQETTGSVVIYVKDSDGNGIPAKVTVYDADSVNEIASGHSTESSPAFFQDAAAVGTSVYVLVEPIDAEHYASYNGGAVDDVQTVVEGTIEFRVTLEKQSDVTETTSLIKIKAVDEKNNALEGATVTLLLSDNPRRILLTQDTDATGTASFQVANDVGVYATAYKTGFLPAVERDLAPGDSKTLTLIELIPGNSGEAKAVVSDDDGNAVEFANVQAYYSDGFYTGIPSQDSAADGSILFSGLPLEELKFYAVHGTLKGVSDAFIPTIQETLLIPIRLEPATGVIRVKPIDVTTNSSIVATVTAFVGGTATASCTNSQTPSCDLKVKANKPLTLKAQATGYAQTTSETLTILPDSVSDKILLMLPTELSQELRVLDYRLMPSSADQVNVSGNLSVLDRGRYYKALLTVNFPSGVDENGAFQRIGEAQTIAEDPAFFSYFEKPATAEIRFGQTYSPGPDCASDEANQDTETKWMDYAFPGTEFGVRTIAAKAFVRPTAESGSSIKFFYRAYSNANNVWIRKPVDAELNYSQRSPEKDECYANSYEKEYSIAAGQSTCSDSACLTVSFARGNQTVGNGLTVNIGDGFSIKINARAFEAVNAPYVKVKVDKAVALGKYVFGGASGDANQGNEIDAQVALDAENSVDGSITALGNLPSQYASVSIEFGDEGGELVTTQRFVIVQGTGELVVVTQPGTIYANERNTLKVFVTRKDNGAAVTDARVSLKEAVGFPFDGSPNGEYDIQGDDTTDNGEDGVYVFKDLQPGSVGEIDAVAERTGFKKASARVRVSARDFLEFNPDISSLQLSCDDQRVDVSTKLNVDVPVTMAFSGSPCVSVSGNGVSSAGFTVKHGKTTELILTPLRNGICYLTFNAVLDPSGAADSQTAWIKVDCQALEPSPTPTVNVTPSACNSANCPACNEQECLYLSQYCDAHYVTIPGNVSQFKECVQKPTPTPVVPTPIPCGPGNCSACDEAQCTTLLMNKSCMPMYKTQLAGYPGGYGMQGGYGLPGYGTQYNSVNSWPYYIPPGSQYYRQRTFDKCVTYKVPEECSPIKFNFGEILMNRLGYYQGNYLFNPGYKAQVTGLSAGTKISLSPQGGLQVGTQAAGCSVNGQYEVTCEKTINPIVPTNAMAFSIFNNLGGAYTFNAYVNKADKPGDLLKCYELKNVDSVNTLLQNIVSTSVQSGGYGGSFSVGAGRTNTWLLQFKPAQGCVNYEYDSDGDLIVKPTGSGFGSIKVCASNLPYNIPQACVTLTLKIAPYTEANKDLLSKYALLYTPFTEYSTDGEVLYNNAFFVNNMHSGDTVITAVDNPSLKFCTDSKCATLADYQLMKDTGQSGGILLTRFPSAPSADYKFTFDIAKKGRITTNLGKLSREGDEALKCSDEMCCNSEDTSKALLKVQEEVNAVFETIASQLETVYYGNIIEGSLNTLNQALDDSIADLEAQMFVYPLCKLLGTDPVTDLQIACSKRATPGWNGYDPYSVTPGNHGLLDAYGNGLMQTACNSQLVNAMVGQGLPAGTGWDFMRNQIAGAAHPGQGEYNQSRFVVPLKLWISVPFKKSVWTSKDSTSVSDSETKAILDKLPQGNAVFVQSFHPTEAALAARDVWNMGTGSYLKNLEGRTFFPALGGTSLESGWTNPFKEATGCLAYYLKASNQQCDPGVYQSKQGNYCGDPVELPPAKNDAFAIIINILPPGTIGTLVDVPKSDVLTVKVGTTPFVLFNLDTQKDNAEKYGAAPPEKVGTLTGKYGIVVPSAPTEAAKYACTPLPTTAPELSTLKYDKTKDNRYLAETYCAKIDDNTKKLVFQENYGACSSGYKRYYVCVPLFSVSENEDCLKLRDVYSQESLLPTMCDVSTDKSGAAKTGNRCRSTSTSGEYKCQTKESQKSTAASTAISSQSIPCTLTRDDKLTCSQDVGTCMRVSPVQFQFTCDSTTLSCTESQGPTQNGETLLTCNKK